MKTHYKNRLPHIAPIGATFFVTFRLADSLPLHVVKALKTELESEIRHLKKTFPEDYVQRIAHARKRSFGVFDYQLDQMPFGKCYLKQPAVAQRLIDTMLAYDGKLYDLQAYCIMPNHVHVLFSMATQIMDYAGNCAEAMLQRYVQLDKVMQLIKGGSAYLINRHLGRSGKLWFKDSYDHFVRNDEEWLKIVNYILRNPVKAGLVGKWEEWPFSFCKSGLLDYLLYRG